MRMKLPRLLKFGLPAAMMVAAIPLAEPAALWVVSSDRVFGGLMAVAYGRSVEPVPEADVRATLPVEIDPEALHAEVDSRFLSVSLDTSQVVGGHWWAQQADTLELGKGRNRTQAFDFERPKLLALARELAPAYLRIGGTEADEVRYDMSQGGGGEPAAAGDGGLVLTRERWDAVNRFASAAGHDVFFTVNAGPLSRDDDGNWRGREAQELIDYSHRMKYPVRVWELGNEVNVFWFTHGLSHHLSAERYTEDLRRFSRMVRGKYPDARIAAGAAFVWPVMGEPPPGFLPDLAREAGEELDVLTWHYYPEQSRRCWSATRRARPGLMLEPRNLDEFNHWADYVSGLRDRHAEQAEVWLGETGGAQCGGEPGITDRFASSLWWLDQLGNAARHGQKVVVRQTLTGSHYGLLDEDTLDPRPDYWSSLLWKRLMGERVLETRAEGGGRVRAYAHCTAGVQGQPEGSVSVLLLNTDVHRARSIELPAWAGQRALVYRVTAPELYGKRAVLNGKPLQMAGNAVPSLDGEQVSLASSHRKLALPPASFTFAVLPDAGAAACQKPE